MKEVLDKIKLAEKDANELIEKTQKEAKDLIQSYEARTSQNFDIEIQKTQDILDEQYRISCENLQKNLDKKLSEAEDKAKDLYEKIKENSDEITNNLIAELLK